MPLFFFIAGLTAGRGESTQTFFAKRFFRLLLPYLISCAVLCFYWLVVARHFGEKATINIDVLKPLIGIIYSNPSENSMLPFVPLWFLTCLFVAENRIRLSGLLRSPAWRLGLISALAFLAVHSRAIGVGLLPWNIDVAFVGSLFILLGSFVKVHSDSIDLSTRLVTFFCLSLFASVYLPTLNTRVDMASGIYGNASTFLIISLIGIITVLLASKVLEKNKVLRYFGQNSLVVLEFHMLGFSLAKAVYYLVVSKDLHAFKGDVLLNLYVLFFDGIFLVAVILFLNRYFPILAGKSNGTSLFSFLSVNFRPVSRKKP